jgi:hypothetical protein
MRYILFMCFIVALFFVCSVGCSSGGTVNPIVPASEDTTPETQNVPPSPTGVIPPDVSEIDYTPMLTGDVKSDPANLLYAGTLELDPENGTVTNTIDRTLEKNYNITGYLFSGGCTGGCFRFKVNSIVNNVWDIDATIENPTSYVAFDVRLIFTRLSLKKILNPDSYTDLFDPTGAPYFNPFIAFPADFEFRPFYPFSSDTEKVRLYWPTGDPAIISYIVTASLPENTQEPFQLDNFEQTGDLFWQAGECNIGIRVNDWQGDVQNVLADTRIFNNQIMYLVSNPEQPDKFEGTIHNINNVYPGDYPILFKASSPNPQNVSTYNYFSVHVTGPIQTPPICDFYVSPDFVYVGQTTFLYPGPGISDPEDNDIVLYEFDFYYNDGVFNAMASNTTGAPVESIPIPYLGPNPVELTMALRITDNGVPPMSSLCTDIVTVSPNQAPVCDLSVVPMSIASGQTVTVSPGPLCKDPDGSIVLYEYDFNNDGTFEASNTTGNPIVSPPFTNPGPSPVTKRINMRVKDNGTPPLSVVCYKEITVVSNQTPICDLVLSAYEINSGASVDCWPGPTTHDPDGTIVLYEYDFNYDLTTFTVDASNTNGATVATGPIDNTSGVPVTRHIAMRVTDNGNPAVKAICTKDLTINPIMIDTNPWRNPAVRVTPSNLNWANIDRDRMENNLCVYGNNVYVAYHGMVNNVEGYYIQRSSDGGVTFHAPQNFNYPVNCWPNNMDLICIDTLANGWVIVVNAGFYDNCTNHPDGRMRYTICKPNASGGVDFEPVRYLARCVGYLYTDENEGVQSLDITAHPTDPNICYVSAIDLDATTGSEATDDLMLWKLWNLTTTPTQSVEFTVVPDCAGAQHGSGEDKAHIDSICDYNGNLHVVWCSRDLGTIYYSMVYGNTAYPYTHTDYIMVNQFGELYPEGAHIAIDQNNKVYIAYAATGIPGEIAPQEIGMLSGVGYPPTFPNPPIILNHDRAGNQVYPDIEFDQTTGDLWVAYTTFATGQGQITFELYDAVDGWTQFEPNYWINKDDPTDTHIDQNVHLYFVSSTSTAYAIWQEASGPNSPHIYFNRTH